MQRLTIGLAAFVTAGLTACGGSGGTPTTPTDPGTPGTGPWAFRASPIDVALIHSIAPLGTVSGPSRWLPTDHLYFRFAEPSQSAVALRTSFFAPADGTVRDVFPGAGSDVGVDITVTTTITYRIGHLIPSVALARGTRVTAGQRLGTTGISFDIDLSLFNEALTLFFVNPVRAGNQVHTDAPLKVLRGTAPQPALCEGPAVSAGPRRADRLRRRRTPQRQLVHDRLDPAGVRL